MSYEIPAGFKEENQVFLDLNDTDNTDVYLIRVPKGFDISRLHGTKFSFNEIKQIGAEERTDQLTSVYEIGAFSKQEFDVAPLVQSGESLSLGPPVQGFLSVNKSYRANLASTSPSHKVQPVTRVVMPEGLRVRFKPFGAGTPYKQTVHVKRKKKHKHSLDISSSIPERTPEKKKRGNKLDISVAASSPEITPEKKNLKHSLDISASESVQDCEPKRKKSKHSLEIPTPSPMPEEKRPNTNKADDSNQYLKKKHKNKKKKR